MNYIVSDNPQGTPEWKADRAGRATGSRAKDILAKIKTGEATARRDYRIQLVTERLTGEPADDGFVSRDMLWGAEQEPFARMAYEEKTGRLVTEMGFAYLPDVMAGCSLDGSIEDEGRAGIWEAKCPKSATHISYLEAGVLPSQHRPQILHNLWITGAEFAEFVSFDPRLPEHLQLFIYRYWRDEDEVQAYAKEALQFIAEVDAMTDRLMAKTA